jgi:pimeloyl-ACP methyl ester carboxylesterase
MRVLETSLAFSAAAFVAFASVSAPPTTAAAGSRVTYVVTPQETDSRIGRFNEPHLVLFDRSAAPSAPLLVFLPGSGGAASNVSDFLELAVGQGYRVVGLSYNNLPAVVAVCARDPDPACSGKVRHKRIFGDDVTARIDDRPEESVVNRLAKLLSALERDHPSEEWGRYLEDGLPRWERIAIAGHSQGAGMAAYIAQRRPVTRVIAFSSPADHYGRDRRLAPWIADGAGATPPERWFGAYHEKEAGAALLARAYAALQVPKAHVRVLALEPARASGNDPYHGSIVGNAACPRAADGSAAYSDDWRFLLGP